MNAPALRRALVAALGGRCTICGRTEAWALTLDHIIPRRFGGTDDLTNLRVLCFGCNTYRRDGVVSDHEVWMHAYLTWGVRTEAPP